MSSFSTLHTELLVQVFEDSTYKDPEEHSLSGVPARSDMSATLGARGNGILFPLFIYCLCCCYLPCGAADSERTWFQGPSNFLPCKPHCILTLREFPRGHSAQVRRFLERLTFILSCQAQLISRTKSVSLMEGPLITDWKYSPDRTAVSCGTAPGHCSASAFASKGPGYHLIKAETLCTVEFCSHLWGGCYFLSNELQKGDTEMVATEGQDLDGFKNLKTFLPLEFLCLISLSFLGSDCHSRTQSYTRVPRTEEKQDLESLWGYSHPRQLIC